MLTRKQEFEKELENDKCCCCLPIVCGMKFLGFFMLLFNILGFIGMCVAMSKGVMPGFAVFLGVLTMLLQIGIIGGVGRWFVDSK